MNKKIIIVGGGVSGLATAIYLQKNGYETLVLEKNPVVGGACMGWQRESCYIDGCIHWLVGASPKSPTYKLWQEIGALTPDVEIFNQDDFYTIDFGEGKKFTLWSDLEKTQNELIAFAPEDEKQIKKFCKLVKRFEKINAPTDKPIDLMNLFDFIKIGVTMAGDYYHYFKACKTSCRGYADKFKNPYLRRWLTEHMVANYNLMSFLYMYAHVTSKDGGIPIGGSLELTNRIRDYALFLGAKIQCNADVETINVENGIATGVTLKKGDRIDADWVICTIPPEFALKNLLGGKYPLKEIDFRIKDRETYPVYTYTTAVFKVDANFEKEPLSQKVYFDGKICMEKDHDAVTFRNYAYDKTLKVPEGSSVVQATIGGSDDMYFWWKQVKEKGSYAEKKQEIANEMLSVFLKKYPELEGKVKIIDMITPITYERYLNGRNGSFQGFVHTAKGKSMNKKGEIKSVKNLLFSGQWFLTSGGLPTAAITSRFTTQRICKRDGVKFKS